MTYKKLTCALKLGKIYIRYLLSTIDKLLEKAIPKGEKNLLHAGQFSFCARHSAKLQCLRLKDHVTLHFSNSMSTTAVFLDINKAFDTTWHSILLYKLFNLQLSTSITNRINSFLSNTSFFSIISNLTSSMEFIHVTKCCVSHHSFG